MSREYLKRMHSLLTLGVLCVGIHQTVPERLAPVRTGVWTRVQHTSISRLFAFGKPEKLAAGQLLSLLHINFPLKKDAQGCPLGQLPCFVRKLA